MTGERDDVDVLEQRGALEPLLQLPRLIAGALDDIHTIARSVRYLPELAEILSTIQRQVDSLDEEVRLMRARVDSIGDSVEPLERELAGVRGSLAPIGRLAGRVPGRRRTAGDSPS